MNIEYKEGYKNSNSLYLKRTALLFLSCTALTILGGLNFSNQLVSADSSENIKEVQKSNSKYEKLEKKFLGNKLFKQYGGAIREANKGNYSYGNDNIYTESEKIPLDFYHNNISKAKYLFALKTDIASNSVAVKKDVDDYNWETSDDNHPLLQQVFNGRTIYYHMNATGKTADIYNGAIQGWNGLGVIQLVPTNSTDWNVIQFDGAVTNLDNGKDLGLTNYDYMTNSYKLANVHISLDTSVVNDFNDFSALSVAEHEIGHALGFAHFNKMFLTTGKQKVATLMNGLADDSLDGESDIDDFKNNTLVGAREQYKLMQMYGLSVMDGYYTYPEVDNANAKTF